MKSFKKMTMVLASIMIIVLLAGCKDKSKESGKVLLGTGQGYEPTIELIKKGLENKGFEVELVIFDGNHVPATACEEGDIDGLVYNHAPWINKFNKETGANLITVEPYIFYARSAMYSLKYDSLDQLPENATIAIPGDPTNLELTLMFLQDNNLIKLGDKKGDFYTLLDVVDNPKNLNLVETEITQTMRSIEDADAVVVGAKEAKEYGLKPDEFLAENMYKKEYPAGLVVKEDSKEKDWVKAAQEIIQSDEFKEGFNKAYEGALVLY